jgi:DNA-binding NtrC family response regulator
LIRVLIVDDEAKLTSAFQKQLAREGMQVATACTAERALSMAKTENFDVAVLDIRLPDMNGVELFGRLRQMHPTLEVVMLTAYASVDTAVESMKKGAYDYLVKPVELSRLTTVVQKAYEKKSLRDRNIVLEEQLSRIRERHQLVGTSAPMQEVRRLVSIVAGTGTPVLLLGETGTGKELVARGIHDSSSRSKNAFVVVDSNTVQENIFESELFGYKKGAFTGAQDNKVGLLEMAQHGTLFIDEVGDISPSIQAKFLRVLETGSFRKVGDTRETDLDTRFIFATNKDLNTEVKAGRFRADLLYRLNTFVIVLPPLRQRKEDVALLADYFLGRLTGGGPKWTISKAATEALSAYHWPGNIRELANVMERAYLLSGSRGRINPDVLPENLLHRNVVLDEGHGTSGVGEGSGSSLDLVERDHIKKVLKSVNGNKSEAARILKITRKRLYKKLAG